MKCNGTVRSHGGARPEAGSGAERPFHRLTQRGITTDHCDVNPASSDQLLFYYWRENAKCLGKDKSDRRKWQNYYSFYHYVTSYDDGWMDGRMEEWMDPLTPIDVNKEEAEIDEK